MVNIVDLDARVPRYSADGEIRRLLRCSHRHQPTAKNVENLRNSMAHVQRLAAVRCEMSAALTARAVATTQRHCVQYCDGQDST
jgi:hypothetical protein